MGVGNTTSMNSECSELVREQFFLVAKAILEMRDVS